ncbi:unnamed protein product [Symbiodinium natans]|uniref:Uncharacterized protein n=1 Tax=Symbiodinium natans TaxID=878477 RepID=A0A812R6K3_9DINO|nr:unnamed protein product [Symbiodinium natans]
MRVQDDLWVIEITDDFKQSMGQVSQQKGSLTDFELLSKVNFTCWAFRAPPEVVIVIEVTLYELGEASEYPNRVDVYAPAGYKFLLNCFAPGEKERLRFNLVSCRERWTLFNGNYLSGAILMAADNGVLPSDMPMSIQLQTLTPALTPAMTRFSEEGLREHEEQATKARVLADEELALKWQEEEDSRAAADASKAERSSQIDQALRIAGTHR